MKKTTVRNSITYIIGLTLAGLLAGGVCARAADFIGAAGVLRQVDDRKAKPDDQAKTTNEVTRLKADLQAFSAAAAGLPAAEAAQRWLALADRAAKVQGHARRGGDSESLRREDLLAALPPPEAWGELARAVQTRPPAKGNADTRNIGLQLLAAVLTGDTNGQNQAVARLSAKAKGADEQTADAYHNYLEELGQAMVAGTDNPDVFLQFLSQQLESPDNWRGMGRIEIPNLVAKVGTEKAGAYLRRALAKPNLNLQFDEAGDTVRLAQTLALELMDQLKTPQWGLINSYDCVELYETIDKHFGAATNEAAAPPLPPGLPDLANLPEGYNRSDKSQAQVYYMLGLISKNRTAEALVLAKKIKGRQSDYQLEEAVPLMTQAGFGAALDNFFHDLLAQDPTPPYWNTYMNLAAQAGQLDRMVALVRTVLTRTDLGDAKKARIHQVLFQALLAADQVEAAVAEVPGLTGQDKDVNDYNDMNAGQLGIILARVGILQQKPEWTEQGIGMAKKWLADSASQKNVWSAGETAKALAELLSQVNRGPEAEAVLADQLTAGRARSLESGQPQFSEASLALTALAGVYHKAGRPADVLQLLTLSPDWGVEDVSDLLGTVRESAGQLSAMSQETGESPLPVPYLAAQALLATGQKEAAERFIVPLQDHYPALDRVYELQAALQGTNALPQLDEWFKRDSFETRPLIWKAELLLQQNRLAEAEQTARQAISVDPTDGASGHGDRLRAYAELGDILAAQGDQTNANFYRELVKSVRVSEAGDDCYRAGLLKRAIALYQEGLTHFADAYCIQSRLAIQLANLGRTAEAEEHYRRAYELMPDSFGRMESYCLGCQRVFNGDQAQGIAEKVFAKFAAEHPDKPQIHYLLGYLRLEENRYQEARTNFLNAVRLDPDYLNAWVKLQEVDDQILAPAKEHDDIAFNLLRLDPRQRHSSARVEQIVDLARLWHMVAQSAAQQPAAVTNLLALPASKLALEKLRADPRHDRWNRGSDVLTELEQSRMTPAGMVAQNSFVRLAGEMIFEDGNGTDD
jgi:tetratricopeptide (TPR) repeat protein